MDVRVKLFGVLILVWNVCKVIADGYIVYCPCMGRFGNQADHFLGALGFAKALNRTLVLPPWVEYRQGEVKSIQVPFDTYFKVDKLKEYHDVVTMEKFMETTGPEIWPPEKRISFCYMNRGDSEGCNAKEGNPFGPFWDTFNIDFVGSEKYGPLNYDVHHADMGRKWNEKYPADKWPVLAFVGAPATFPVQIENRDLHKYLEWNDDIAGKAKTFIKTVLPVGGFIGIHLRNGIDWVRACEHIQHSPNLFSAPQCLGYRNEFGVATMDMCLPSSKVIVKQLKRTLRNMKDVASIFVASDSNHMIPELKEELRRFEIEVHKLDSRNPHVDLAILALSNHFIGNCISSFSAFVKRERDARGFKSTFWGFPTEKKKKGHDEL
ncbi:UNVERIFIED_CONTAM: hypothetical protein PYX00_006398 [Menopon gallinae]|uniref:GDP-fucose protein O-fucosyltransferase 1 n=1 Tax=Menopon gallinae TaxID=328185 RepID=A0AAW2HV84_9NEOP